MTMSELEKRLHYYKIPQDWYCLKGFAEGAYGISWEKGRWTVYVGERGGRNPMESFETEAQACEYLGDFLVRKLERAKRAQRQHGK